MSAGLQRAGFYPQSMVGRRMQMQTIIAVMLHDGSFHGYSLDEKGELIYDKEKNVE